MVSHSYSGVAGILGADAGSSARPPTGSSHEQFYPYLSGIFSKKNAQLRCTRGRGFAIPPVPYGPYLHSFIYMHLAFSPKLRVEAIRFWMLASNENRPLVPVFLQAHGGA